MKRIVVICEGPTEIEFCKELLFPYFMERGILIQSVLPDWSRGGNISWGKLQRQIITTLKQDPTAMVTTFIDLYGLHKPELFPMWEEATKHKKNPYQRVNILEEAMSDAIPPKIRHRFIPNIILHEFEGLLFNELIHFENYYNDNEFKAKGDLISILNEFKNPELINETKENSPSHRLDRIFNNKFTKQIDGIIIALDINLDKMRRKSPHFNDWITKMENIKLFKNDN